MIVKKELINNTKLWKIQAKGKSYTVQYGKVGGKQTKKKKTFDTQEACQKDAEKLIKSKIKGGYIELTLNIKGIGLDLLYRIEQVQRGNATIINEDSLWVNNKEVLEELWKCTHLEKLILDTNFDIPEELGNLINLKELNFSVGDKRGIPKTIKNLKNLEKLTISLGYDCKKPTLIPDEIGELSSLKKLRINGGGGESVLPDAIAKLTNLETLTINQVADTELPKDFGNLSSLKSLYIHGAKKLKTLPSSIGNLINIEELEISGSRGDYGDSERPGLTIPKEIGKLISLIKLNLKENGIESLPDEIGNLNQLTELIIEGNSFNHFPIGICRLTNLETLEMYSRSVTVKSIPEEFIHLENLEDFEINLSEESNIPSQFLAEGFGYHSIEPESIIDYLKNHSKKQASTVAEDMPKVPSNKEQLVKSRWDAIEEVFSNIYTKYDEEVEKVKKVRDFVTGESDKLPLALREESRRYEQIVDLLAPLKKWNFIDERILLFIAQDAFYYQRKNRFIDGPSFRGYHKRLFKEWFLPQLENEQENQNLLKDVFELLINQGIDEEICFESFLSSVPKKVSFNLLNKTPNSVGKYILNRAKKDLENLTDSIVKHKLRSAFIRLMLANDRQLLDESLPKMLVVREYEGTGGAHKHIPFSLLELLVAYDFKAYEHYVHELVKQTDCHECIMECYRVLLEHNEKEYREVTLSKVKETLAIITEKKRTNNFSWSLADSYGDQTAEFIDWALKIYGKELKDTITQYVEHTKTHDLRITEIIVNHFGQGALDIIQHDFKVSTTSKGAVEYYRRLLGIIARFDYSAYYDKVWGLVKNKKVEISQMAAFELVKTRNPIIKSKALEYLSSKKDADRLSAMRVFYYWRDEETIQAIQPILKTESKEVIRELAVDITYSLQDIGKITIAEMKERIQDAATLNKLDKKIVKWQNKLPQLIWSDGKPFTQQEINYLFYRQNLCKTIAPDVEAQPIYHLVEKESAKEFVKIWWEFILKNNDLSIKEKGVLAPIGIWGGEEIIEGLAHEAIKNKKVVACKILGLMNTEMAAWTLDKVIKVNETKQNQLLREAETAFTAVADNLGLTSLELQERMIPDFGFTEREFKFTENGINYIKFIDSSLHFSYKNGKGKIVKSIAKASPDFKKNQKEDNALLRAVVKQFAQSMNHHLVTQRFWFLEDWKMLFLRHPVAFAFAQGTVWTNGKFYFIVQSNGSIVDLGKQIVQLGKEDKITLAHPINMGQSIGQAWITYLEANSISSRFNQLTRDMHELPEEMYEYTMDNRFDLKQIQVSTFKYRATKAGWRRGLVSGGMVTTYKKTFEADNVEAFIETNNLPVREGYEEIMMTSRLYFVPIGTVRTDSYVYENPYNEEDDRLIPFKEIPPIVFSEVMADLMAMTEA